MKNRLVLSASMLSAALLSTGCVEQRVSRYPSLQPRPIERRSNAEPVAAASASAVPDPSLDATLVTYAKTLATTDTGFTPAADTAERAVRAARGDTPGGERWITAQTALAKLDSFRAATSSAVTDLDELAIGRARDAKPPYPALEALHARGEAQLTAEVDRIAAIQAMLPGK
ncbi:hypothetical protein [Sphingomonas sp. GC_Shp_3]|uniref:hypothetical protein n=1 Tax=Sphingomonas sp. GC_Shp_3 TaxID=2937383 RepID=UPI00226ACC29|nr:hypothetical protein [Sphingomonas sp. GC_Shp_3]